MKLVQIYGGVFQNQDAERGPDQVCFDGIPLLRFMDAFYLRCETDELSADEVNELCRARARNPQYINSVNDIVRGIFRQAISALNPKSVLEIGAGENPIFPAENPVPKDVLYTRSDADPTVAVDETVLFSESNYTLPYSDEMLDIAAAVFVLHFPFHTSQIAELFRCLTPTGVFLSNVYLRSPHSRRELLSAFQNAGFVVEVIADSRSLCRDHEYWIAGKDAINVHHAQQHVKRLSA